MNSWQIGPSTYLFLHLSQNIFSLKWSIINNQSYNLGKELVNKSRIHPMKTFQFLDEFNFKKVKWHFKLKCSQKRISSISWIWNMMIVFVLLDPPVLTYHLRLDFFSIRFNRLYCWDDDFRFWKRGDLALFWHTWVSFGYICKICVSKI